MSASGLGRKTPLPRQSVRIEDLVRSQTPIAAISGLIPMTFMTRVRL